MKSFTDDVLYMGLTTGPDQHAVTDMHGRWTWQQLHEHVESLSRFLASLDIPPRSRVVLLGPDSAWHHIALLACARSGMIFVPINARYTPADADHVMRLIRPTVGLIDPGFAGVFAHTDPQPTVGPAGPFDVVRWSTNDTPDLSQVACRRTPILVTLTSGSTAAPKPVLYSAEGEVAVSRLHGALWRLNSADVVMAPPALSWIYGLGTANLTSIMCGSRTIYLERFSPRLLCERAEDSGISVFMGVVTHFRILVEYCEKTGARPFGPELRMAASGGERRDEVAFNKFEQMFGVPVHDLYASSEGRPGFGYDPIIHPRPVSGSCGRVIPGAQARVDTGDNDLAGELHLRSDGNYMGYFDPEKLVREEITAEDWIPMGDRFEIDQDGWGFVVGRSKEVIIRGGANISPVEVESVLADHPSVEGVAVVGLDSSTRGEDVAAAVIGDFTTQEEMQSALEKHCEGRLASFKIPTVWKLLRELPRNSNDKVDKPAVKKLFETVSA